MSAAHPDDAGGEKEESANDKSTTAPELMFHRMFDAPKEQQKPKSKLEENYDGWLIDSLDEIFGKGKLPNTKKAAQQRAATTSPSFICRETGRIDFKKFKPKYASPQDLRLALQQALDDIDALKEKNNALRQQIGSDANQLQVPGMARDPSMGARSDIGPIREEEEEDVSIDASSRQQRALAQKSRNIKPSKTALQKKQSTPAETNKEIDRLKQQVDQLTSELERCRKELQQSRAETQNVRAWLEASWADRERLEDEIAQLQEAYPDLVTPFLQQSLKAYEAEASVDEDQLPDEIKALIGLRSRTELEAERQAQIKEAKERIAELEKQLNEPTEPLSEDRRAELEGELFEARLTLQKHHRPLFVERAMADSPSKSSHSRTDTKQSQNATTLGQSPAFISPKRLGSLTAQQQLSPGTRHQRTMSDIEFFIAELEADLTMSQHENSMLKTQLEANGRNDAMVAKVAMLEQQLKEREEELAQIKASMQLETKTDKTTTGKDQARSPNDGAAMVPREEYDDLEERRAELDVRCTELEIAVVGLEEERNRWNRERAELEEELNTLTKQRESWDEEREKLKIRIAELEEAVQEHEKQLEDSKREIKVSNLHASIDMS
jgi:chromosome segregation ATPase